MRIGFISYWFNRGQAMVARHLREDFEKRGHDTHVFARLTKETFIKPLHVRSDGVWDQDRVTRADSANPSDEEIIDWARAANLDVVHCDQFYQFSALERLRQLGIAVVGRFVWESFGEEHVTDAKRAIDIIYSFNRCEQVRYKTFGIESPYVPFGCRPIPIGTTPAPKYPHTTFFCPGGFLSLRKPMGALVEAFMRVSNAELRLLIKTQRPFWVSDFIRLRPGDRVRRSVSPYEWAKQAINDLSALDHRITVVTDDLDDEEHFEKYARSHICAMPSRWEGLGLHLYESLAFGVPLLVTDAPPMNEVAVHNRNGYLVPSAGFGLTRTGTYWHEPDVTALTEAFEQLADPGLRQQLEKGARDTAIKLDWNKTLNGLESLFQRACACQKLYTA